MIALYIVGDGPRDHVALLPFLQRVLEIQVRPALEPTQWKHLRQHKGTGFDRKLLLALRQARDARADGLVAMLDQDNAPRQERLRNLLQTREQVRNTGETHPIALGQATPHGEAWLLDDHVAVQRGLRLPANARIPAVIHVNSPKAELERRGKESCRCDDPIMAVLADIAQEVDPSRCRHRKQTGFQAWVEDVKRELGPLCSRCGEECRCGDACAAGPEQAEHDEDATGTAEN
jgi:hypothetical protein